MAKAGGRRCGYTIVTTQTEIVSHRTERVMISHRDMMNCNQSRTNAMAVKMTYAVSTGLTVGSLSFSRPCGRNRVSAALANEDTKMHCSATTPPTRDTVELFNCNRKTATVFGQTEKTTKRHGKTYPVAVGVCVTTVFSTHCGGSHPT